MKYTAHHGEGVVRLFPGNKDHASTVILYHSPSGPFTVVKFDEPFTQEHHFLHRYYPVRCRKEMARYLRNLPVVRQSMDRAVLYGFLSGLGINAHDIYKNLRLLMYGMSYPKENGKNIRHALKRTYGILSRYDLEFLMDIPIHFCLEDTPDYAGIYYPNDAIFIVSSNKEKMVPVLLHEIGHELYFQFFDAEMKDRIDEMFNHLTKTVQKLCAETYFPTRYSATNPIEWWAELFSHVLTGKVTGEPAAFVQSLIASHQR